MAQTKGRPPSKGPRTGAGRPAREGRGAFILFHRLHDQALSLVKDPRILTELTLLKLRGLLTDTEVATGLKIAETYGRFERHKMKRRSSASPAYERAYGDPGAGEDQLHPEDLDKLERRIKKATAAWERLQDIIDNQMAVPKRARELIERVCVENRRPLDAEVPELRYCLKIVAAWLAKGSGVQLPTVSVAVSAQRQPRRNEAARLRRERAAQVEKTAWIECQRQLLASARGQPPSDDELETAWRGYLNRKAFELAKADRGRFRHDKQAGRPMVQRRRA